MARLQRMARAAASKFDGLEEGDFLSEAWLAYTSLKESGKPDVYAFAGAEYAIKSAMVNWIAVERGGVIIDGANSNTLMNGMDYRNTVRLRTRLPRVVKRSLNTLSKKEKRILYLTTMWNRTTAEIALELDMPVGTVASARHKALLKLRMELGIIPKPTASKGGRPTSYPPFKDPDGHIHIIIGSMKDFAAEHGLDAKAMLAVKAGRQSQHRGWTVFQENTDECQNIAG
jgi:RNA polymerase sigma factor (sigma-70 family)